MRAHEFWQPTLCVILLSLLAVVARGDDSVVQTGWMERVEGSRDSTVGAELVEIEDGDTANMQKITVAIPKDSISSPGEIEEVVVIGQRPEAHKKPEPVEFTYEWVSDYDSDNYGLVIHLGKDTNWPIRLYMNSDSGFVK